MIALNSFGSIHCVINLKSLPLFNILKPQLKICSIVKSSLSKQTGVANSAHSNLTFKTTTSIIASPPLIPTNNKAPSKRCHCHLVETGLTLLAQSGVPHRYWHLAFDIAVYLINRMPSSVTNDLSPYQLVFHQPPDYSFLGTYDCLCFPLLRPYNKHKMDYRSSRCIFLGYSPSHTGYRCLDISSNRTYIVRHVRFDETQFPFLGSSTSASENPLPSHTSPWAIAPTIPSAPANSQALLPSPATQSYESLPSSSDLLPSNPNHNITLQPTCTSNPPRSTTYNLRPNPPKHLPLSLLATSSSSAKHIPSAAPLSEPSTFSQAIKIPEWRSAMNDDFRTLERNHTWTLVPRTRDMNLIGSK